MPRNSSGNYTLPAGNPVVTGTPIATDWANNTLDDIAFQLNGVVTQNGLLPPTAPLTLVNGTEPLPGLSFTNNLGTGLWNALAGAGYSYNGVTYWAADPTGMNILGLRLKSGVVDGEAAVGQLTVGGSTPNAAALLDIQSTTKGFKPPSMTTAQKTAIGNVAGLVVYDTNKGRMSTNNGAAWVEDPVQSVNGQTGAVTVSTITGNAGTATAALGIKTATTTVSVSAATAPTAGQVLTASSTTLATWVTPVVAIGSVSGLGTGVATFLATPSSANLAATVTGETGTGALVFATSPTLVTPLLGTPTSGVLTNCTGTAAGLTAGNATVAVTARNVSGGTVGTSVSVTTVTNTGGAAGDVTIGPGLGYDGGSPNFAFFGRLIVQNCETGVGSQSMTLGSTGPGGAQPTVQGWLRIRISGSSTDRYIPFW